MIKGDVLYANCRCFEGKPESHYAEAVSIREALSRTKAAIDSREGSNDPDLQLCRFVVESDCQLIVNDVLHQKEIYSAVGSVIDERRSILQTSVL